MSAHSEPTFLQLRGTFLLPALREQGLQWRIGEGHVLHALPIDEEHIIIHTDSAVSLRSLLTQEILWEIDCPSFNWAIDCQHQLLVLAPGDTTITLWDLRTGQPARYLRYEDAQDTYRVNPNGLALNADGTMLAAGMKGHKSSVVVVWDTTRGQLLHILPVDDALSDITTLAFHPTQLMLAGGSFNNHRVWFWDLEHGELLAIWEPDESGTVDSVDEEPPLEYDNKAQCNDRPYSLTFCCNGTLLCVGWGNCGLRIWDVEQGREVSGPERNAHPIWVTADPAGRYIAFSHFSNIHVESIYIVETTTWKVVREFTGHNPRPFFSDDGQLLTIREERTGLIRLFHVGTWSELYSMQIVTSQGRSTK